MNDRTAERFSVALFWATVVIGSGFVVAISFGTALKIMFGPDGTLIDNNGSPINGTVFLSVANNPASFRAVTVLGATGRVRSYRWNGVVWGRV